MSGGTVRLNDHMAKTIDAVSFFQNPKKAKKLGDASVILQETKMECKALLAKLGNIVMSEDNMHKVLNDGLS